MIFGIPAARLEPGVYRFRLVGSQGLESQISSVDYRFQAIQEKLLPISPADRRAQPIFFLDSMKNCFQSFRTNAGLGEAFTLPMLSGTGSTCVIRTHRLEGCNDTSSGRSISEALWLGRPKNHLKSHKYSKNRVQKGAKNGYFRVLVTKITGKHSRQFHLSLYDQALNLPFPCLRKLTRNSAFIRYSKGSLNNLELHK